MHTICQVLCKTGEAVMIKLLSLSAIYSQIGEIDKHIGSCSEGY